MKKILIILALILPLSAVQAIIPNKTLTKGNHKKSIQMPKFSVIDINNKTHNNDTVKGKYLVVNFWATWCPPCLKEIPAFVDFYEKNSDRVEILGVNYEQADIDKIIDFTDTYMVNYPIILSNSNNRKEFEKFGKIVGLPTTYVYAPDGSLVDSFMGEVDIKTLKKATQQ
jgi:thiol-disulfide isomerase/thioredoxin